MALDNTLILVLLLCHCVIVVRGTVVDIQSTRTYVHCLDTSNIIQINDPFRPSWFDDIKFIALEWYQYSQNGTQEVRLLEILKTNPVARTIEPRFNSFQFFGLQINNVDFGDTATYTAKLVNLAQPEEKSIQIVVARSPVLQSERLSMTQTVNQADQSVTLLCGQVVSLGTPPISILLKASNGTVLPSVYRDGFVKLTVSPKEAESGKFYCDIDTASPAAKCIDNKDLARWRGAGVDTSRSSSAGSDLVAIIIGVVAAVIVIAIIIIIIFLVRRRNQKTNNAASSPEKITDANANQDKSDQLLRDYENPYDRPSIGNRPIYKGPRDPGPYMVSKLSPGIDDADVEYEEMQLVNGGKSPPQQYNSGKFVKRGDNKDKKKYEKDASIEKHNGKAEAKEEQKPTPRVKPRSIFLTPSMEELDKIGRAVAGGEGSGATGPGTQV